MAQEHSAEMRECIDNCTQCHNICVETTSQSIEMGDKFGEISHVRILQDCAQICATSADFMLRRSDMHAMTCGVCAEACERCADECERLADGDELMRRCAEMCRRCAESCRKMAA